MSSPLSQASTRDDTAALRREVGAWLREKREAAGLSQRELAAKVGFEYYTFISQIEAGRGRVPSERYEAYARALDLLPREFTLTMLRFNDPIVYRLLEEPRQEVEPAPSSMTELEERLRRLEARLID